MYRILKVGTVVLIGAGLTSACATKGQLRQLRSEYEAALSQERSQRIGTDEELRATLGGVTTDLAALRTELEGIRDEFGAQITALNGKLQFVMPVHFDFDKSEVKPDAYEMLDRFAGVVQEHYGNSFVTVEGFADPAGSESYNRRLSQRRAEAVQSYLADKGVPKDQLRTVGLGESRQVVPGAAANTPGAELNRRVVFVIEGPVSAPAQTPVSDVTTD